MTKIRRCGKKIGRINIDIHLKIKHCSISRPGPVWKAFNSYQQFFRKQPQFTCAASCFLIATAGYHWEEQRKYLAHRKFFCSPAEWLEFRLHVYNQHLRAISPPLWESGWGSCLTLSSNAWSNACLKETWVQNSLPLVFWFRLAMYCNILKRSEELCWKTDVYAIVVAVVITISFQLYRCCGWFAEILRADQYLLPPLLRILQMLQGGALVTGWEVLVSLSWYLIMSVSCEWGVEALTIVKISWSSRKYAGAPANSRPPLVSVLGEFRCCSSFS